MQTWIKCIEGGATVGLDRTGVADLAKRGRRARNLISGAGIHHKLRADTRTAWTSSVSSVLTQRSPSGVQRQQEDFPTVSFADQRETYPNIRTLMAYTWQPATERLHVLQSTRL